MKYKVILVLFLIILNLESTKSISIDNIETGVGINQIFKKELNDNEIKFQERRGDLNDNYKYVNENFTKNFFNIENYKMFDSIIISCMLIISSLVFFAIVILKKRNIKEEIC